MNGSNSLSPETRNTAIVSHWRSEQCRFQSRRSGKFRRSFVIMSAFGNTERLTSLDEDGGRSDVHSRYKSSPAAARQRESSSHPVGPNENIRLNEPRLSLWQQYVLANKTHPLQTKCITTGTCLRDPDRQARMCRCCARKHNNPCIPPNVPRLLPHGPCVVCGRLVPVRARPCFSSLCLDRWCS